MISSVDSFCSRVRRINPQDEAEFALQFAPNDVTLLHRKGLALARRNDVGLAREVVSKIYAIDPELQNNPEVAGLEGRIFRTLWKSGGDTRDLDSAIDAYKRAYDQDRLQYYPGINAAELFLFRKRFDEAEALFRQSARHLH